MKTLTVGVALVLALSLLGVLTFVAHSFPNARTALPVPAAPVVVATAPAVPDEPTPPLPAPTEAKAAPELDALFQRKDDWIGGDGVYSVALTPERTLWLFSDTWVGRVRDGKRLDAKLVNNSVAFQAGRGPDAKMTFVVRKGDDGKPAALIVPADKHGWYWPQAAVVVNDRLYAFMAQMDKTGEGGAFGFRSLGRQLAVVANPHDAPADWRVEQLPLPCTEIGPKRLRTFGSAALRDGAYLYVYGIDEDVKPLGSAKHLIVARVPVGEVADVAAWRFYHDGDWQTDFRKGDRLADGFANEYSVSYLPGKRCFVAVYTQDGLSPRIVARTAPRPWGPWSAPTLLYECPEMAKDKRVFSYAAKAHPMLAADDELVVSYVVNAYDFWLPLKDAQFYWPRFVRVKFAGRTSVP